MFTDEVGDTLVEVKKYDETEPIMTPEPDEESIMDVVEDRIELELRIRIG